MQIRNVSTEKNALLSVECLSESNDLIASIGFVWTGITSFRLDIPASSSRNITAYASVLLPGVYDLNRLRFLLLGEDQELVVAQQELVVVQDTCAGQVKENIREI